jgi:hypothetical protein
VFEEHRRRIDALGRPAASVLRVFEQMQRNPIISTPGTAEAIGFSAPTGCEIAQGQDFSDHAFVYDAYLVILSETEPIR